MNDKQQPQQQQHVIASPNPTIKEAETDDSDAPPRVTDTRIKPVTSAKSAPMKPTAPLNPKPKRRRARPPAD